MGCSCHRKAGSLSCGCSSWKGSSAARARSAGALAEAGKVCEKWSGATPGAAVPCRSKVLGRTLELRLPGSPRQEFEIEACAIPRPSVRPSKRCKTAFLARPKGTIFGARAPLELVDGGKVRNASRTPRPTHAGMSVEWVSGKIVDGPAQRLRDNRDTGAATLEGIDLPFPHRVGSSVCCPESTLSALALGAEVRDAAEDLGEVSPGVLARLRKLAAHLATRHRVEGLPGRLEADDIDGAFRVVEAGTTYCENYLRAWQDTAEASAALRKVERKKAKSRKASAKRRANEASKTGGRRAVEALQRQTRKGTKLRGSK